MCIVAKGYTLHFYSRMACSSFPMDNVNLFINRKIEMNKFLTSLGFSFLKLTKFLTQARTRREMTTWEGECIWFFISFFFFLTVLKYVYLLIFDKAMKVIKYFHLMIHEVIDQLTLAESIIFSHFIHHVSCSFLINHEVMYNRSIFVIHVASKTDFC